LDLLVHATPRGAPMRPFVAVGAGATIFIQFAALTHTSEIKPLLSAGGGMKFPLRPRLEFRAEVRDYITPAPEKLMGGATVSCRWPESSICSANGKK